MPHNNAFANGKSHPRSPIGAPALQTLEKGENAAKIAFFKAYAVIFGKDV
jgi:hypothetical protein